MTTTQSNSQETQTNEQLNATFFDVLNSRRSVREYDSSAVISEEEIRDILATAIKAPSSSNMQPWRFLVVTDPELKQKLLPIAFNQKQVAAASAIVIVLADLEMYTLSEKIYGSAIEAGFMTEEVGNNFIANSTKMYSALPAERLKEIVVFDTGLVAMQLMLTARAKGYDSVPMGGYNRDQVMELFNISDRYLPTLMLPIGKAAVEGRETTRLSVDDVTFFNKF
ncbi:nitroreductase family protein [Paenibacillus sp. FSL A5-0031]|uniref:nitroreductase family protein n=1 Tax=unclassified Paenibacillus TaxID=185978 RepID=UPI00096DA4BB|nr:nitroreductase family protein [Paenibacillus sp. FSL A5-0031]OME70398.1 nitroreductase family protein [Paenibacillus sp. FSL A5-0031]